MNNSLPDWVYAHKRATEKQKRLLRRLGVAFNEQTLTKTLASRLIGENLPQRASRETTDRPSISDGEVWARRHEDGWGPGGY
jgi:hypothetical protein